MYDRIRIITTSDSDHKLLQMFSRSFEKLKRRKNWVAPTVVSQ